MNRVQKKCLIASMGAHVLLGTILLLGVAFANRHKDDEEVPPMMTLIPSRLVDAMASGGGNPNVTTPPAAAPQLTPPAVIEPPKPEIQAAPKPVDPVPTPEPQKPEPKPEPRKPRVKSHEPEPNYDDLIAELKDVDGLPPKDNSSKNSKPKKDIKKTANPTATETKKHEIKVNLTPVKNTGPSAAEVARAARQHAEALAKQKAALEAYRVALEQRSSAMDSVLNRLDKGLSTATTIEMIGEGGEAFANYGLFVRSMYDSAWSAPQDAPGDSAKVEIKVIVARDGQVVSSEITRKSGNPALDKSVQRALNAIQKFPPFPAESSDRERIFIINFDLKAKRQIG